jgi:hypothetical protein
MRKYNKLAHQYQGVFKMQQDPSIEFHKTFNQFKETANESKKPSVLIPREIFRWILYKKLVEQRTRKFLLKDKEYFLQYLIGDTLPMSRAYESHPNRCVELNPMYNLKTRTFPRWEKLAIAVNSIGRDKKYPHGSVKFEIIRSLSELIYHLRHLNLKKLDEAVGEFDEKLKKARLSAIDNAIEEKVLLVYPNPTDIL